MTAFHDDDRTARHLDAQGAETIRAEQDARWGAPDTEAEWDAFVERIKARKAPAPVNYFGLAQAICLPAIAEAPR